MNVCLRNTNLFLKRDLNNLTKWILCTHVSCGSCSQFASAVGSRKGFGRAHQLGMPLLIRISGILCLKLLFHGQFLLEVYVARALNEREVIFTPLPPWPQLYYYTHEVIHFFQFVKYKYRLDYGSEVYTGNQKPEDRYLATRA